MEFEVGEVVEIISNDITLHGFEIGERVVVRTLGNEGEIESAHALNDKTYYWYIEEEEVKKVEQ